NERGVSEARAPLFLPAITAAYRGDLTSPDSDKYKGSAVKGAPLDASRPNKSSRRGGREVVDRKRAVTFGFRAGAGADRSWIIPVGCRSSADPTLRRRDDRGGRGRGGKRRRSNRHRTQRTRRHHSQRSEPARAWAVQQHYARPVHN